MGKTINYSMQNKQYDKEQWGKKGKGCHFSRERERERERQRERERLVLKWVSLYSISSVKIGTFILQEHISNFSKNGLSGLPQRLFPGFLGLWDSESNGGEGQKTRSHIQSCAVPDHHIFHLVRICLYAVIVVLKTCFTSITKFTLLIGDNYDVFF